MANTFIRKTYDFFYNMVYAVVLRLFRSANSENGIGNERADLAKTVSLVQDQPVELRKARPIIDGVYGKRSEQLEKIIAEIQKNNSSMVQQLDSVSSENEILKNRLDYLEKSQDAIATVAVESDLYKANIELFDKLDGFMEKIAQTMTAATTMPTNEDDGGGVVENDSTSFDGQDDSIVYEGLDKKIEKLQITMNALIADKESLVRLNTKMNREIGYLKSKLDVFERDGHCNTATNDDYNSLKSDFDQIKDEMQLLKGSISTNNPDDGETEKLTRKYDKMKMKLGFIEQDLAHNSMSIHRSQQSLQNVVKVMTAKYDGRVYSQQLIYEDKILGEPAAYSNPPQHYERIPSCRSFRHLDH